MTGMILEHQRRQRRQKREKQRQTELEIATQNRAAAESVVTPHPPQLPTGGELVEPPTEPVGLNQDLAHEMTEPDESAQIDEALSNVEDKRPSRRKKDK